MPLLDFASESHVTSSSLKKLETMVNSKTSVILNHANWCGHCHMFMPQWNNFVSENNKKLNIIKLESSALNKIEQVNPKLYKRITKQNKGQTEVYFPMIVFFIKNKTKTSRAASTQAMKSGTETKPKKYIYEGDRNKESLESFITEKTKVKETKAKSLTQKKGGATGKGKTEKNLVDAFESYMKNIFQ